MKYIVGIDPGLSGGIALYNPESLFAYRTPVVVTPFVKNGKKTSRKNMALIECRDLLQSDSIDHVFLELVSAMPGQGVTGMFRFGQNLGQWQGLIAGLNLDVTYVRPQVWKKSLNLIGENKNKSVDLARDLFPDNSKDFKYVKADEGRAEASLIAYYGWNTHYNT